MSEKLKESHLRSIIKGFTWRIIASSAILIITYLATNDVDLALKVTGFEFVVKIILYYFHERVWQQVPRGAVRKFFRFNTK